MDNLPDYSVQAETRQMQTMQMYQKLVFHVLLKFKWSILLIFAAVLLVGAICRYIQFKHSPYKYEASVTLFYTPRASEEVKILSIKHILGIFSRQQVYKQIVDELNLNEKQKAVLKKGIVVELLRDQNDMFIIKGKGESEEYTRNLVNTFAAVGIRNYEEYRYNELRTYLDARERRLQELQLFQKNKIEALHALHRKFGITHPKAEMETVKKMQNEQNASRSELNIKLADARNRFAVAEKKYKAIPQEIIYHRVALRDYIAELKKRSRQYEQMKLTLSERNPRYVESKISYESYLQEYNKFKADNNIPEFNETILTGIEGIVNEYTQTEVALNQLELSFKSLLAEIAMTKEKEHKLQHMIPEHDSVEELLKTASKNISLLVEELSRVRSSITHVPNDININERVAGVTPFKAFPPKVLILLFIAALFVSSLYATIMVFYDIVYGTFSGIDEAVILKDFIDTVGIIPDASINFTQEQRNVLTSEMFYNFILRLKDTRTLFSCSLNGSFLSSVMFDEHFSKAKRNTILVRIIAIEDTETICKNMQKIGDFYYSDNGNSGVNYSPKKIEHDLEYLSGFSNGDGAGYGYGYGFAYFPVRNISGLEPDEITTLYNIINELKNHYQLIRISRETPFDATCLMVRQLHDICDATMLYIGKRKTSRRVLRRILKLHDDKHKTYAIITGVTQVDKIISGDYIR